MPLPAPGQPAIVVLGVRETIAKLRSLPDKIQRRVLRKAVNAGAGPFLKSARSLAPRQSGLFVKSLASKIKVYPTAGAVVAVIGQEKGKDWKEGRASKLRTKIRLGVVRSGGLSRRGDAVPIHLVESPVKPHRIPKHGRGPLALRTPGGAKVVVSHVDHPGTRGTGFLAKAYATAAGDSETRLRTKLAEEVEREAGTSGSAA